MIIKSFVVKFENYKYIVYSKFCFISSYTKLMINFSWPHGPYDPLKLRGLFIFVIQTKEKVFT